jgi:hypothetical protein
MVLKVEDVLEEFELLHLGFAMLVYAFAFGTAICAFCCYENQRKMRAASERVLEEHPELAQSTEDYRVYARKVMHELGWDSISFTFN